jgi:hypothetical protein
LKTNIIISTQAEGIHYWPECNIKEVEFLRYPHRHIFFITAKKEVSHLDRDIEIINLKREINAYLNNIYAEPNSSVLIFGSKSCEMIALDLLKMFDLNYCSVLEDNENGAEIYI